MRKAQRAAPKDKKITQKDVVLDHLDDVIASVSGDGEYRFNTRQIFYQLRPIVLEETGEELKLGNYTSIITDYEAEYGEISGMYREPRLDLSSASRRNDHARHAHGRAIRTPGLDLQQIGLHREGRCE
jgi:hypothetical protein